MAGFFEVTTMLGAVGTVVAALYAADQRERRKFWRKRWGVVIDELSKTRDELFDLQVKDEQRRRHLRNAGAKGKATQVARAAEARAERATAEMQSRGLTLDELRSTSLRPRDEVVAGVIERRANKNAGAGVAAIQEG